MPFEIPVDGTERVNRATAPDEVVNGYHLTAGKGQMTRDLGSLEDE
jgi:hypothetical protein